LPRRQIAITRASVTSCAVIAAFIDQPTTRLILVAMVLVATIWQSTGFAVARVHMLPNGIDRSASVTPGTQFRKGLRAQSVRSRAVREFSFSADCSSRTAGRAFAELDELHFQIKKPARDLAGLSHLSRIAELELCNQMVPPNWPSGNRELARNLRTLDPRAR
jgi:hypothetical protein